MLKRFFNKESPVVYALESIGVCCLALLGWRAPWTSWPPAHTGALLVFCLLYLFLRVCATVRWYPRAATGAKYLGIELHFKKALVPTSYLLALTGGWLGVGLPPHLLYVSDLLLGIIAHANAILLYFHWRDRDPTPVNASSRPGAAR